MRVEVINTGTELLLGAVINTHLRFFAEALFPLGLRIARQVAVPDGTAIRDAIAESFGRADLVLVTGGLGPTSDDVTRERVAELLGLELLHDETVMSAIRERFARRGLPLSERVGLQALRPREALVLPNEHGTAPGLYLPPMRLDQGRRVNVKVDTATSGVEFGAQLAGSESPHLFLLPGPPRELHPMFIHSVLPILQKIAPPAAAAMRSYRVTGLGESMVEELVGDDLLALGLELGYCARPGEVDVRTIGTPDLLARAETILLAKLGQHIVSGDNRSLEEVIIDLLAVGQRTVAVAESCTGGFLANRLTNVSGSSRVFVEGFVTYANAAKVRALSVDAALIDEHGAVSADVAAAMCKGALRASGADYALATTGIAGPGGGTPEKPVGAVYIAFQSKSGRAAVEWHNFPTDRETFKVLTTQAALDLLRRNLDVRGSSTA